MTLMSSYCCNWGSLQTLNSETTTDVHQLSLAGDHCLDYTDENIFLDPFPDPDTYPDNYTHHFLLYPDQYFNPCPYPKRQKGNNEVCCYSSDFTSQTSFPNNANTTNGVLESGKKSTERCVSAPSVAARERRRKITGKTQELGRLIPGGSKMNTAEMLEAAFKYVKYLQAQVGILHFFASLPERDEATHIKEMQILASAAVQEKLYMEAKCLVPNNVIEF